MAVRASRLLGVGIEELLAVELIGADGFLPFLGNQPVDEGLAFLRLDVLVTLRIHQDHAILVEEAVVSFDQDLQVAAVLEADPGAAISERVRGHLSRGVQGWTHPGAGFTIPASGRLDFRRLPDSHLRLVGAGIVTAGRKGTFTVGDSRESGNHVAAAADVSRVGLRAHDHVVVVHHLDALDAITLLDELLLGRPGMDEDDVGVTPAPGIEGLPGALGDDPHLDAGLFFEERQDVAEEAGLLGGGGRGDGDEVLLSQRGAGEGERKAGREQEVAAAYHSSSPFKKAAAAWLRGWVKNSSAGVCSTSLPWCRKMTSSARRRACPRLW